MAPRTPSARQIKQGTAAARAAAQAAGQSRAAKRVGRAARDFWAGQQAAAGEYRFARPSLWFGGQGSLQQPAPAGVNKALYRAGNVAQDIMGHGTNARTLFNLHPADFTSGIVQTQVNRRTAAPNAFAQMAGFGAVGAMGFGSGNIGLDLRSGLRPAGYQSLSAPDPERLEDGTVTTDYTRSTNPAWDSFNRVTLGRSGRLLPFEQYIAERDDKARQHGLDPAELQGLNMLYKGGSDKLTGILDEQQFFSQNRDYVRRVGREQAQQTYQNLLGAYGEYADYNEYLGKPMSAFDYAKLKNAGKKPDTLAYEQYRQDTYDSGIAGGLIRGTTDGIEGSGLEARIMGYRVTPGGALAAVGATAAAIAYGQQRWGKGNGRGRAEYSNVEPPPPLAPDTPGGAAQQATRPPSNARGSGRSPSPSIAAAESVYARAVNAANQVPAERLSVGKIQRGLAKNSATAGLDSLARKQMAQQIYQQSMRSRQGQATQPQQQQQAAAPRSLAEQQALQRQQQAAQAQPSTITQPYQQQQAGAFPGTPRTPQPLTPAQAQAEAMARPSGAMEELMRNPTTTPAQRLQQQQQAQQQAMQQRLMGGTIAQPYQQQQEGRLVRPGENVAARAQIPQAAQKMQGWTGGQGRDLWGRAQGIATLGDAQDPRYGLVADYSPGKGYEGFMTYRDQGKNLSITSVGAKNPGNGSGRTMFETLRAEAAKTGKGIKVIGGDDAAGFYQRMGMTPGAANEFTMTAQQVQQAQQQAMQQRLMGGTQAQPQQQQQAGPPKKPKQTRLSPQRKAAQAAAEALGWDFQVDRGYLAQEVSIYNNQGQALGSTTSITEAAERMGRDAAVLEQLKQQASLSMQAGDTAQFNRVAAEMDKIQSGRGGALLPMTPQQQATAFANKRQELRSKYSGGQPTSRIQRMQQQGRTAAIAAANNQDSAPQVNEFIRDKGVKNPWGEFGVADAYEMDSLGERMRTIEARREAAPGISRFLDALKKPLQRQPLPPDVPQPPQAPDWRTAVPDPTIGMTPDQLDAAVNRGLYGEPGYVPDPVGAPSRKARIAEIYSKIRERANPALNGQDFRQEDVARLTRAEVMAGNYPAPQLERFELAAQKSIARNAAKAAKRAAKPKAPDWRTAVPDPTIGMTPDQLDAAVNRGLYGEPGYVPDPVPEAQGTGRAARITKPSSKPKAPDWRTAVPNPAIGMTPDQLDEAINRGLYGDPGYVPDPVQAPGAARIAKPPSAIDNQIAGLRGAMGATDQNMAAMKQRQADLAKAYGAPQGIDPAGAPGRRARFPGTNLGTPPSRAALGLGLPPQRPAPGDELAARRLAKPPAPPKPPGTMGQVRAIAPDTVGGAFSELRGAMAATDQSMAAMKKRQAELAKKYGKPPAPEGPSLQELFRQADEIGSKYQDPSDPLDFNAKQGANRILGEAGWGEAMGKGTGKIRQLPTPRPPSGAPTLAQPGAVVQFPGPKPPAPRPYIESPRGERIKGLFTDLKELGGQKVERGPVAPPPQNVVRFPELSPPRPVKVLTDREARLTGRDTKAAKPLAPVQQLRPGQVEPPPIASKARMRKLLEDLKISAGMDPANTLPDPIPGKTAYFPPQPPAQNAPPMGTPGTVTRMGSRIPDPWRGPAIAPAPPVRPAPAVARPVPQLPAGRAGAIAALPAGRAGGALAPAARPGALSTPGFFGGDISGAISNQRGPAPKITPQLPGRIPAALPAGRTAQALPPARVATIPASRAMVEAPARAITPTAARLSGGMIQTGTPTARAMGGGAVINSGTKVAPPAATKLGKGLGVLGAGLTALSAANEFRRAQKEGAGLGESAARGVVTLATDTAAWVGEPLAKGLSGAAYSYNPANYVRAAQAAMGDKRAEQALRNSRQAAKSREAAISQGFANLPKMAVQGVMGLFSGKRGQQQAAKIAQDKRTTTPAPTRATAPAAMATAPIGPQLPAAGRTAAAPQSDFQKLFGPDGSLSPYGENMQSSLGEYGFNQLLKESYKAKTAGTGTTTSGKPANQRDYMGEARTRADAERYKSDGTVKVGLDRNLKEFQGKIGVAQINAGVGYDKNARVENVGLDANAKRLQGQMYVSDNDLRGKLGVAQINAGVGYDKNARVENVGLDRNLKELQGKLGVAKISAGVGYDKNAREENVGLDRNLKEYQGKVDVANISGGWDYRKGVDVERVKGSNRLAEVGAESAAKIAEGKAAQKAAAADRANAWGFERVRQAQGRKATQQQRQADAATQRRAIANDQYLASVASSDATRQRAKVGHSEAAARNVERERLRTQERVARIGQRHDPTALINSALSSGPRRW